MAMTKQWEDPCSYSFKMQHHDDLTECNDYLYVMLSDFNMSEIVAPHLHDVICGRGAGSNAHIGNAHWRMLVAANKELYVVLSREQKRLLSESIVRAVRSQCPPGRFLQRNRNTGLFYDIGDQKAIEKTSQALREGAPVIRRHLFSNNKENTPYTEPMSLAEAIRGR